MKLKLYDKNPWQLLYDSARDFDNWWGFPSEREKQGFPVCDFYEDKDHYFISFDLPGLDKDHIKIHYENSLLTVSGLRKEERREEDTKGLSRFVEKFYGSFSRSFNLPSSIEEEKIEAHFTNGVLELYLPKAQKSKGREIPVKEGKKEKSFFAGLKEKKKAV